MSEHQDGIVDIAFFLGQLFVLLIPSVLAITLHEYAHGWMALRLGDTTARDQRRLSLNPLRHIDPVGSLLLPVLMLLLGSRFIFGWAKPVPVDFNRLRYGRLGVIGVAMAGPFANAAMIAGWFLFGAILPDSTSSILLEMVGVGMAVNYTIMIFNLVPIPPLDGGRILDALLPPPLEKIYSRVEPYGIVLLFVFIATGMLDRLFDFMPFKAGLD